MSLKGRTSNEEEKKQEEKTKNFIAPTESRFSVGKNKWRSRKKNWFTSTSLNFIIFHVFLCLSDWISLSFSVCLFNIFDQVPLISILPLPSSSFFLLLLLFFLQIGVVTSPSSHFLSILSCFRERKKMREGERRKNVAEKGENNGFEFLCRSLVGRIED